MYPEPPRYPPLALNQELVLRSFYDERQRRANPTTLNHSLIGRTTSYFSNVTPVGHFTQASTPKGNLRNDYTSSRVRQSSERISEIGQSFINKYSHGADLEGKQNSCAFIAASSSLGGANKTRSKSEATTPKSLNESVANISNINKIVASNIQSIKQQLELEKQKQNAKHYRQQHIEQLQNSFRKMPPPANESKPDSSLLSAEGVEVGIGPKVLIEKLNNYLGNQNGNSKDTTKSSPGHKKSEMSENINIINNVGCRNSRRKATTEDEPLIVAAANQKQFRRSQPYEVPLKYQKYKFDEPSTKTDVQGKLTSEASRPANRKNYQYDYSRQQSSRSHSNVRSPSFKMDIQQNPRKASQKKTQQQNQPYYQVQISSQVQQPSSTRHYEQSGCRREQNNNSQRILQQQLVYLKERVSALQKINKKQSKFIDSVFGMRRAIEETSNDCNLKQLWRWLKALPIRK